jgi:hypothetical protein
MKFKELVDLQKESQKYHLNLVFETIVDNKNEIEFLPFIY